MENLLKLIVIDVDGTMTDGGIYYDEYNNEMKKFNTRDAAGFFAAHQVGIKTMILTGRESIATFRRMKELNVDYINQNVKDKYNFLKQFINENKIEKKDIGYIGDDINDLPSMQFVGFVGCPADSCQEIISRADYVSPICGGYGAVRDIIEYYLRKKGVWTDAICKVYGVGI